ncbi:MAG: VWA domain-containing protein [Synergistaceae bacterium]|nr:VWA domain-containing protein [Synergistaceae bacterium]
MFINFFYRLRACGVATSLNEWLMLMDALEKGFARTSMTEFYNLCRSMLVKSERDFDKFDNAFLMCFGDMETVEGGLSEDLLRWLDKPKPKDCDTKPRDIERNAALTRERIEEMFEERLKEQKEEHNGGTYWIGTGGGSPFGNDGEGEIGIRVGGKTNLRRAFRVASEHKYRDFREDEILSIRQFQMAFRSLRQFSSRIAVPKTELDIDETIRKTCGNAGRLEVVFGKPRKNTVKLLLLMDTGGSMDYYSGLCATLFQSVIKANHFRDLKIYYFHNCIRHDLYTTPIIGPKYRVATQWVLNNLNSDFKVLIVGDALMDTDELVKDSVSAGKNQMSGLKWLRILKRKYPSLAWVNPENLPSGVIRYKNWGESYDIIRKEVDMYSLTVEGLRDAIKHLLSSDGHPMMKRAV